MYIRRHAEKTVEKLSKMFGAVLVAGPRQVGKTTMPDRITEGLNRASPDDLIKRAAAEEQSGTFFLDNPPPVFVDEIQKAPALLEQIKLYLDYYIFLWTLFFSSYRLSIFLIIFGRQ